MAALEILMAARGFQESTNSMWQERQARGHLKTLREIFYDCKLDDKSIIDALVFVHCFLTGLTLERIFESKVRNLNKHLQRIKLVLLSMLTDA
jgi:hypothetical protein